MRFDALGPVLRRARRSTLVHNAAALYGVHAAGLVLPLITIPYLARVLRPEGWGGVVFAQSFAAWLMLVLEFGFYLSGTRMIARARGDEQRVAEVVAGVQGAKGLLLLVLLGLSGVAYLLVPAFQAQPIFLLLAVMVAVSQGFSALWYFQGLERMRAPALVEVAAKVAATLGVFIWVHQPEHGWRVLALQAGTSAAWVGLTTFWMYREVRWVRTGLRQALTTLREAFGLFVFRSTAGAYTQANSFILGLLAGPQAVAFFGGAERIVRAVTGLIEPASRAIYPRMSHLAASDPRQAVRLIRLCLVVVGGLGLALGALVAGAAPLLVRLLLGEGYEAVVPVLRVLALLPPLIAVGTVLGIQWALPLGHDRLFYALVAAAAVLNVCAAWMLAPAWGAMGMAAAVVAAESVVTLGLLWFARQPGRGLRAARIPPRPAAMGMAVAVEE